MITDAQVSAALRAYWQCEYAIDEGDKMRRALEAADHAAWQGMESAPKDEKLKIIVQYDHDADTYYDPNNPTKLTNYSANIESGRGWLDGKGICLAVWRGPYRANDGWEAANSYIIPPCWFEVVDNDASDYAVNPIKWRYPPEGPE